MLVSVECYRKQRCL